MFDTKLNDSISYKDIKIWSIGIHYVEQFVGIYYNENFGGENNPLKYHLKMSIINDLKFELESQGFCYLCAGVSNIGQNIGFKIK